MDRRRFIGILSFFYLTGLGWIVYSLQNNPFDPERFSPCIFKAVIGFACPSCGSGRALMEILQGDFADALSWNPIGYLYLILLVLFPFWLGFDLLFHAGSMQHFYKQLLRSVQNRWVAIPFILLLVANWIRNIQLDF